MEGSQIIKGMCIPRKETIRETIHNDIEKNEIERERHSFSSNAIMPFDLTKKVCYQTHIILSSCWIKI